MAFNLLNLKRRFGTKTEDDLATRLSEKTLARVADVGPMISSSTPESEPGFFGMYSTTGLPTTTAWNSGVRSIDDFRGTIEDTFTMPGKPLTAEDFKRLYLTTPWSIDADKISAGTITSTSIANAASPADTAIATKIAEMSAALGKVKAATLEEELKQQAEKARLKAACEKADEYKQRLFRTLCHVARLAPDYLDRAGQIRISDYQTIGRKPGSLSALQEDVIGACHKLSFRKPEDAYQPTYADQIETLVRRWSDADVAELCALADTVATKERLEASRVAAVKLAEERQADLETVMAELEDEVDSEDWVRGGDW